MERDRRQSNYRKQQPQRRDAVFSVMLGQITVCLILLVLAYCLKLSGLPVYNTARTALEDGLTKELDLGVVDALLERFHVQIPVLRPEADAEQAGENGTEAVDADAAQTGAAQRGEAMQGTEEGADEAGTQGENADEAGTQDENADGAGTQGENADEAEAAQAGAGVSGTGRADADVAQSGTQRENTAETGVPAGTGASGVPNGNGGTAKIFDDELAGYVEQYLPKDEATMASGNSGKTGGAAESGQSTNSEKTPSPPANIPREEPLGQGGGITPVSFSARTEDKNRWQAPAGTFFSPFYLTQQPVLPVKSGTLTSRFGYRTHPVTGKADFHTGTDIAAPSGTPIATVLPGTVSEVGVSDFYGNYVIVRHGSNLETLYGHCSAVLVEPGTVVRAYETIAKVGSTGMSTGNHVHLEFRVQGQKGDPAWVYDEF